MRQLLFAVLLAVGTACIDYQLHKPGDPTTPGGTADTAQPTGQDSAPAPTDSFSGYGQPTPNDSSPPGDTAVPPPPPPAYDSSPPMGDTGVPPGGATASMYAQSAHVLYAVDPTPPYAVTKIGTMKTASGDEPSITDIAIDGDGYMYAVSFGQVFEVDPTNAALTALAKHSEDTVALSFLDDGTLVAGGVSQMYIVDRTTGDLTKGDAFSSWSFAGDVVGLPDGYLYCAMSKGTSSSASYLVVYDPVGKSIVSTGATGVGSLFGVAYANSTLFGFSSDGDILTIDPATGTATVVSSPGIDWYGAATNPWKWP